jgi:hypothetical protein
LFFCVLFYRPLFFCVLFYRPLMMTWPNSNTTFMYDSKISSPNTLDTIFWLVVCRIQNSTSKALWHKVFGLDILESYMKVVLLLGQVIII